MKIFNRLINYFRNTFHSSKEETNREFKLEYKGNGLYTTNMGPVKITTDKNLTCSEALQRLYKKYKNIK